MKKVSVLALTLIFAVLLCSCNVDVEGEGRQTSAGASEATQAVQTAQTTQTTQAAQTAQTAQITEATTQSEAEAVELTEYDINKISSYEFYPEYNGLDFLSEEQQRVFTLASFVYTTFDLDLSFFFFSSGIETSEDRHVEDTIFYHTGFTYESVLNGFLSVLSEDIVGALLKERSADLNGEFVCGMGARGGNASFMGTLDFEPIEVTDDIVRFKALAGYGDPNSGTDEILSYEEVSFEMRKIDGKWIVTEFEMWA